MMHQVLPRPSGSTFSYPHSSSSPEWISRQHVTPDDIQAEVREQHEAELVEHVQLVRDLRVQLRVMRVVRGVEAAEGRDGVQGEAGEEGEGVVEGEALAAGRVGWKCATGLGPRGEGRVM